MSLGLSGISSLVQQIGETRLHANVMIIVLSSCLGKYKYQITSQNHQVVLLTADTFLNLSVSKARILHNDLVIITGHKNESTSEESEMIIKTLDKIGVQKVETTVWVDWFQHSSDLDLMISKWTGIQNYAVNSNLYFHLVEDNLMVEAYSIRDLKVTAVVLSINIDEDFDNVGIVNIPSIPWRRRDFKQIEITGHHVRKWNVRTINGRETIAANSDDLTGPSHQYLAYSQDFLNFSLQTKSASAYATLDASGKWIGLVSNILDGESDMSISASAMMSRLAKEVRFLTSALPVETANMNYISKEFHPSNIYFLTFQTDVMCSIIVSLIAFLIAVLMISRTRKDSFWWILGWATMRGWIPEKGTRVSIRCLAITVSTFSFIIYSTFAASLTSAISNLKRTVDGIDSLIDKGYSFGVLNNSYMAAIDILSESQRQQPCTWAAKLFSHRDRMLPLVSKEDGALEIFRNTKYVFVTVQDIYQYVSKIWPAERICAEFYVAPVQEYAVRFASFVRKDSPFIEHFNFARLLMRESGIAQLFVNKKKRFVDSFKPECPSLKTRAFRIEDVTLPIYIWAFGTMLALVILIVKMLLSRTVSQNRLTKNTTKLNKNV